MSREWCVRLWIRGGATIDERDRVEVNLADFDVQRDGDALDVFGGTRSILDDVRRTLRSCDALEYVELLELGEWSEVRHRYVFDGDEEPPSFPADEMFWAVTLGPVGAFDWMALRDYAKSTGRPIVNEPERGVELGAFDEEDATAFAADAEAQPFVGRTSIRKLGRVERWLLRERLLGNYAGDGGDPSQSL